MDAAQSVVTMFNNCINTRDLDHLSALMTDDHRFIDTADHVIAGKAACVEAWRGFFAAFPDYHNVFARWRTRGDAVAIEGRSECSDERLSGDGLWRAVVRDGRLAEWRVFNDTPGARRKLGLS